MEERMNRTTAIIVTIVSALACGVPSLILMCLGVAALFGAQSSEIMAQNPGSSTEDVMFGSGMLLCFGAVLLIIPILVGVFSFGLSKKTESMNIDYIPPAS
jgi:hypothetical protein